MYVANASESVMPLKIYDISKIFSSKYKKEYKNFLSLTLSHNEAFALNMMNHLFNASTVNIYCFTLLHFIRWKWWMVWRCNQSKIFDNNLPKTVKKRQSEIEKDREYVVQLPTFNVHNWCDWRIFVRHFDFVCQNTAVLYSHYHRVCVRGFINAFS